MKNMDPTEYYNQFSKNYDKPRDKGYHAYLDDAETECIKEFAINKKVMEVGCGTGLIMKRLEPIAKDITGIDISPGMLAAAKKRGLDVKEASATALPFEDSSFDLVYSFKVLAHIPMIRQALSEMVRVTKPGGIIAAEFYNSMSFRHLIKLLRSGKVAKNVSERDVFIRFDTIDEFRNYFPDGLELIRICSARHCLMSPLPMNLPVVGRIIRNAEITASKTPLKYLGGFVTLVLKKT
jgi:ubiquinone/menaquinone biosynthesis C-methylase UbiE